MSLLSKLLASVHSAHSRDQCQPGVVLSDLDGETVYASVCRYPTGPASKVVIVSAKAFGVDAAVRALAVAWIAETRNTDKLRQELELQPKQFDSVLARVLA